MKIPSRYCYETTIPCPECKNDHDNNRCYDCEVCGGWGKVFKQVKEKYFKIMDHPAIKEDLVDYSKYE